MSKQFNDFSGVKWCPETDLNRRHADFQSAALPTELSGHRALAKPTGVWWGVTRRGRGGCPEGFVKKIRDLFVQCE
jgi:hypothetical protein